MPFVRTDIPADINNRHLFCNVSSFLKLSRLFEVMFVAMPASLPLIVVGIPAQNGPTNLKPIPPISLYNETSEFIVCILRTTKKHSGIVYSSFMSLVLYSFLICIFLEIETSNVAYINIL